MRENLNIIIATILLKIFIVSLISDNLCLSSIASTVRNKTTITITTIKAFSH